MLSDTHGRDDARLEGAALASVDAADVVVHAGDFTTAAVVSAFEATSERLVAVHGNVDEAAVKERLPATATLDVGGRRLVVVHGHEHDETARALLGRQEGADVVVSGHSHRAAVVDAGDATLLNPGSHAEPRGGRKTHAELEPVGGQLRGRIVDVDGTTVESFVA